MNSTPGDRATSEAPGISAHLSNLEISDHGLMTSQVPPSRASSTGRYVLTAFHVRRGNG